MRLQLKWTRKVLLAGVENDDKIIRIPYAINYVPDNRGVGYEFFTHMQNHKDKIVQIDVLIGEEDTFSSLLKRCIRTAITMRSKGITSNDIISLCTFNHLNTIVPVISAFFIGAKVASLDPTLSVEDRTHLLNQIRPKMIFVIPGAVGMITKAATESSLDVQIVVFGETTTHSKFSEFLQFKDEE